VLLYDAYSPVNPSYPYWEYDDFCLDSFDSNECITEFRVNKEDLPRLADALCVPRQFRCSKGTVCMQWAGRSVYSAETLGISVQILRTDLSIWPPCSRA
jgi:hypothetical protein